jgi:dipeptidyl-peptidase-4
MGKLFFLSICLSVIFNIATAQPVKHHKANYALAAKFSPKKIDKMLFSTAVDPHWLKNTNRFWYAYETPSGKKWQIVDPVKGTKLPLFDNDKLAAALTKAVKDPFDAQHLGIENLKFLREDMYQRLCSRAKTIHFLSGEMDAHPGRVFGFS